MKRQIEEIQISQIDLDTSQPRQVIEEDKLKDLAEDIKEVGMLVPILLTPCYRKDKDTLVIGAMASKHKGYRWFVLDGYRRILAAKRIGWKKIDAELKFELNELEVYEVQFRANAKRVQVTVKEMSKAIERYANVWKKSGKKGDIVNRLSKITGYSTTYFDMAKCIVDEEPEMKKLIHADKVGAYLPAEAKASTKNSKVKEGMYDAIKEYVAKNPTKKVGALTPRVLKPEFKKIERTVKGANQQKSVAKAKTLDYLNRAEEKADEESNYEKYLYEAESFYQEVLKWNIRGLTVQQVERISEAIMKSVYFLKEEKRTLNKFKQPKRKGRNM
jgi:ParB/RepB/Spo0J family partition protein